eukprot:11160014-Lingulodinium_polyedra.AAC.1
MGSAVRRQDVVFLGVWEAGVQRVVAALGVQSWTDLARVWPAFERVLTRAGRRLAETTGRCPLPTCWQGLAKGRTG